MLRITIESDGTGTTTQATRSLFQEPQAMETADAGPGPGIGTGDSVTTNTAVQAADTGGPPQWLNAAIDAAMAVSQASFGTAPEGSTEKFAAAETDGGGAPAT